MLFLHFCNEVRNLFLLLPKRPTFLLNLLYILFDAFDAFFHKLQLKVAWVCFHFFDEIMFFDFFLLKFNPGFLYFIGIFFLFSAYFTSQGAQVFIFFRKNFFDFLSVAFFYLVYDGFLHTQVLYFIQLSLISWRFFGYLACRGVNFSIKPIVGLELMLKFKLLKRTLRSNGLNYAMGLVSIQNFWVSYILPFLMIDWQSLIQADDIPRDLRIVLGLVIVSFRKWFVAT